MPDKIEHGFDVFAGPVTGSQQCLIKKLTCRHVFARG